MSKGIKYNLKSRLQIILILFCVILSRIGIAQNPEPAWDLKSCIEYAAKNNIGLNTLRLTASSGQQDLRLAKNSRYPDLNGTFSHSVAYAGNDFSNSGSYGISSSVVLFRGGYYNKNIKSSELALQAANLDVKEAENDITLRITQAYLNVLLARENIKYVKDLVATSESQTAQSKEKYNMGSIALKDVMQLQSDLAEDRYTLVEAENLKRQNLLTLKSLLQLPTDMAFDVAPMDDTVSLNTVLPLDVVQKTALQIMPEIQSSEILVNREIIELAKTKSSFLPTLNLGVSLTTGYLSETSDTYWNQFQNNYIPQAGISLSIPIFNHSETRINVAKSKIALEQARLASENSRTTLMSTIEQAFINVQNAQEQYKASLEHLNYAKESYRISDEQLKIGANNNVEYLQQKNLYIQAFQEYIQAKYTVKLYTKIYNFYRGIPVTE